MSGRVERTTDELDTGIGRRRLLKGVGLGIAAVPLAGCTDEPIRDEEDPEIAPPPARNLSEVGLGVLTHSGEVVVSGADLDLPGRGDVTPNFERRYRSSVTQQHGDFGKGFTWTYSKRITEENGSITYDNGYGEVYPFEPVSDDEYHTDLLYATLLDKGDVWEFHAPGGRTQVFEPPEQGGRLRSIVDRNGNAIDFEYEDNRVVLTGPRGRPTTVRYENDRIESIEDYAGRMVTYEYDREGQLRTVTLANGGQKRYEWDDEGRLHAVFAPGSDQPYVVNTYDEHDRVVTQRHGEGTIDLEYEWVDTDEAGYPIYRTHVSQKGVSEPNLHLTHDAGGHVVKRVFDEAVEAEGVNGNTVRTMDEQDLKSDEDEVAHLETRTEFNEYGEWIHRKFPTGNRIERTYDENAADPRARGNLLEQRHIPAQDDPADHGPKVESAEYNEFQRRTVVTDARGNTTQFKYDERGNLIRRTHPEVSVPDLSNPGDTRTERHTEQWEYNQYGQVVRYENEDGSVTRSLYYPESGPYNGSTLERATDARDGGGGPLARVVDERDTAIPSHVIGADYSDDYTREFEYNDLEHVVVFRDGEGNVVRHEYDAHGNPIQTRDRAGVVTRRAFDENDNTLVEEKTMTRNVYDRSRRDVTEEQTVLRQYREYDLLNNVVAFGLESGDKPVVKNGRAPSVPVSNDYHETRIRRDARANVIYKRYPDGTEEAFTYSRRGKRVEWVSAPGSRDEAVYEFTFRRDGQERTRTDAEGFTLTKGYDGFQRLQYVENPDGMRKEQSFDENDNVTEVRLLTSPDDLTNASREGPVLASDGGGMALATVQSQQYDARNRCTGGIVGPGHCAVMSPGRAVSGTDFAGSHGPGGHPRPSGCGGDDAGGIIDLDDEIPDPSRPGPDPMPEYDGRISNYTDQPGEMATVVERTPTGSVKREFTEDGSGTVTEYQRDGAGLVIGITSDAGDTTVIARDGNGQAAVVQEQGMAGQFSSDLSTDELPPVFHGGSTPDDGPLFDTVGAGDPGSTDHVGALRENTVRRVIERDEKGREVAVFENDRLVRAVEYNEFDQVMRMEDVEGYQGRLLQDIFGRQHGVAVLDRDRGGWVAAVDELNEMGELVSHTDFEGHTRHFQRDDLGRVVRWRNPDETTGRVQYNGNDQVTAFVDPNGNQYLQEFNDMNRLSSRRVETAGGETIVERYGYDYLGRMTWAYDETNEIGLTRSFDEHGMLSWESQFVDGEVRTVNYGRNADGSISVLEYPDGEQVHYGYDRSGRLERAFHDDGRRIVDYEYDDGRLQREVLGGGVLVADVEWDQSACGGRCLSAKTFRNASGSVVGGFRIERNNDRTIRSVEEPFYSRKDTSFGTAIDRDSRKRPTTVVNGVDLSEETKLGSGAAGYEQYDTQVRYQFDDVGRIAAREVRDPDFGRVDGVESVRDPNHNYRRYGALAMEYDDNGNRTQERGIGRNVPDLRRTWSLPTTRNVKATEVPDTDDVAEKEYEYDYRNRVAAVRCYDERGTLIRRVRYQYGLLDRLLARTVEEGSGHERPRTHRYTYAGRQVLREEIARGERFAASGAAVLNDDDDDRIEVRTYYYGGRLIEIESDDEDEEEEESFFVTHDAFGRNTGVIDEFGRVKEKFRHDLKGDTQATVHDGVFVEDHVVGLDSLIPSLGADGADIFDFATGDRNRDGIFQDAGIDGDERRPIDGVGQGGAMDVGDAVIDIATGVISVGTGIAVAAIPEPTPVTEGVGVALIAGGGMKFTEGTAALIGTAFTDDDEEETVVVVVKDDDESEDDGGNGDDDGDDEGGKGGQCKMGGGSSTKSGGTFDGGGEGDGDGEGGEGGGDGDGEGGDDDEGSGGSGGDTGGGGGDDNGGDDEGGEGGEGGGDDGGDDDDEGEGSGGGNDGSDDCGDGGGSESSMQFAGNGSPGRGSGGGIINPGFNFTTPVPGSNRGGGCGGGSGGDGDDDGLGNNGFGDNGCDTMIPTGPDGGGGCGPDDFGGFGNDDTTSGGGGCGCVDENVAKRIMPQRGGQGTCSMGSGGSAGGTSCSGGLSPF